MNSTRRMFFGACAAGSLYGQTADADIFQAAARGDVKRAAEILDADAERVRARSADGRTPLHYATAEGKPEMVMFLLARGAELSTGRESPLVAAVDSPSHETALEMATPLINNASDPNARSLDGRSVLEIARSRGHTAIADMLIHRGAKVADMGKIEVAWFGRRYAGDAQGRAVQRDDLNGLPWTKVAHFVSIAHFDFEQVKKMIGEDPRLLNTRASWDELGIESASHTGQTPIAEWLAERGAVVSTCTATLLGLEDRVKASLAADGRCVRERGPHDIAILAYTAYGKERAGIAEMLLKAGADVNSRALNLTALHLAAMQGYADLAALLVEHGAEVNLAVKSRGQMMTPLQAAITKKQEKVVSLLRDRGAK